MIFFSKGKRGKIYLDKNKAIKQTNKERAKKEAYYLKLLNKYNIGPKFFYLKKDKFVYEFIKGPFILEYIEKNKKIKPILIDILKQCRTLDKLKINKLELHNPYKHIIIRNNKPIMIDFERCYSTNKPKNVTQFCQYLMSFKVSNLLSKKGIKFNKKDLIKLLKVYKKEQKDANFKRIIKHTLR